MQIIYIILLHLTFIYCTVDINLSELQYLADHLHIDECRFLVASLHFNSYGKPNALAQAEEKISKDIPCLRLLLHWNSSPGEGKGETHEAVQHRLRQIGRTDLADWLGKTVYHELGKELNRSLQDPFDDIINTTEKNIPPLNPESQKATWDPTEWIAFDTICWAFLIGLTGLTLIILIKVICMLGLKTKHKKRKFQNKQYKELANYNSSESEDSEDKFDIRLHKDNSIEMRALPEMYNRNY